MQYGAEDLRSVFNMRALRIVVLSAVISVVTTLIGLVSPVNIEPHLAVLPVIGILFGPFGALGADLVSLISNYLLGVPPPLCALDFLTTFMVSYIPYRIWYSSFRGRVCRSPILDTVGSATRFIVAIVVNALVYGVLYNITYGLIGRGFDFGFHDLALVLNVMSFSFVFGLTAVLLLRYLHVQFYTPALGGTPDGPRRRVPHYVYDLCLLAGWLLPSIVALVDHNTEHMEVVIVVTYAFLLLFMLKPIDPAVKVNMREGAEEGRFNNSLIERLMAVFLAFSVAIAVIAAAGAYSGVLKDFTGAGPQTMALFYMGAVMMGFFIPAFIFLWYVERKVSVPLTEISTAARNLISSDDMSANAQNAEEVFGRFTHIDSEIGDLASSMSEMTMDMDRFVHDIRELTGKQKKMEAELHIAKTIQESFIPKDFDSAGDGVRIWGTMTAAKFVGGDLYDFFRVDEDHLAIAIADVSGKGVPAAFFMALTKAMLEMSAMPGRDTGDIMVSVNEGICRNNEEGMFVTSWVGVLELSTGRVRYANAGHNQPVIVRKGHPAEFLTSKPSLVLGGMDGVRYKTFELILEPGDRLVLYTDGVTEANDSYKGFYGEGRLLSKCDELAGVSVRDEVEAIRADVLDFTGEAEQFDDITILGIEYVG